MGATQIRLTKDDGWWIAEDTETGVVSQGESREEALTNLDEAVDGYHGAGDEMSDEALRDAGVDPSNNESGSLDSSGIFE
jgi:predicted RNase H-like HicB family nuclease